MYAFHIDADDVKQKICAFEYVETGTAEHSPVPGRDRPA